MNHAHMRFAAEILSDTRRSSVEEFPEDVEPVRVHEYHTPGIAIHHDPGHAKHPGRQHMKDAHAKANRSREGRATYYDKLTFGNTAWDLPSKRGIR